MRFVVVFVLLSLVFYVLGIVTRRPLVLQLHRLEEGRSEYAEFLHAPRKKFTDFGMLTFNTRCIFSWNDVEVNIKRFCRDTDTFLQALACEECITLPLKCK